jgi:hypothetical protein
MPTYGPENTQDFSGLRILTDQVSLGKGTKTASATAGAATLNQPSGVITTETLTTAQNASYTLTLTNSKIRATDIVFVSLANGTNSQGTPVVVRVTPANGSVVVIVKNMHDATQALNGTLKLSFVVVNI